MKMKTNQRTDDHIFLYLRCLFLNKVSLGTNKYG